MNRRTLQLNRPLSLGLTLRPLAHGSNNPCARFSGDQFLWAARNPEGPVAMRLTVDRDVLTAQAWGSGASWQLSHLEEFVGEHQTDALFTTDNSVVHELHRRLIGLRIPRTRAVFASLLPAIIGQRVTGIEASHAYRRLVTNLSEPAPGPLELYLPPEPQTLAQVPYWVFHRYGVERKRADTIRHVARLAKQLETCTQLDFEIARKRLQVVPGVGPWTAATVATTALGDSDAVIVGDFHIPHTVAWVLAGEPRGDDVRMLELLEPFRGQRALVTRLLLAGAGGAPKFGPRYTPLPIANY